MSRTVLLGDILYPVSETMKFTSDKVVFLNTSDIDAGKFLHNNLSDPNNLPGQAKKKIQKDDILFSEIRPANKRFAYVYFSDTDRHVVSTKLMVLRSKELAYPRYAYYWLTAPQQLKQLQTIAESRSGTFPQITFDTIKTLKVMLPDFPEQVKIADFIDSIDEKIELNRRMNRNLEQMGKALFRHYFIDSPDVERWSISTVGQHYNVLLGGTPSREKTEYWEDGTIGWINSGKVNEFRITEPSELITEEALGKSAAKLLPAGTTVIAITGATLGQISRLEKEFAANQSVIGMVPKNKMGNDFIYYWISYSMTKLIGHQTGGAQQHINRDNVLNFELLVPEEAVLNVFKEQIEPISDLISNNSFEIKNLINLRDTLLPRLINGKVKLNG